MKEGTLAHVAWPSDWSCEPLWSIAPRQFETGHPDAQPLSVFLNEGVVPRSECDGNNNRLGSDLDLYLHVLPGDLVFNKLRTWQGGVGVSAYDGIVSPAYFVCRPSAAAEPRYLHHLMRSAPYRSELTRLSKWMPPSQFDISWDVLRTLPVLVPPIEEQRRIADFLDDQVARLDRAIELRQRQIGSAGEREHTLSGDVVDALVAQTGTVPLRRLALGIEQGSSPECNSYPAGPGEFGVLKVSAVRHGRYRPTENKHLPMEMPHERRFMVREGDLLVSRGSGSRDLVGDAAVATPSAVSLLLPDLLYRVRLRTGVNPEFVAATLLSPRLRAEIRVATRGAVGGTIKLRGGDILDLAMPCATAAEQESVAKGWRDAVSSTERTVALLHRQITLLTERKQALITAAVTGEFDVRTARTVG